MGFLTIEISDQWHTTDIDIRRERLDYHQPRNIFVAAQTIIRTIGSGSIMSMFRNLRLDRGGVRIVVVYC
jgi:hypothetical protein